MQCEQIDKESCCLYSYKHIVRKVSEYHIPSKNWQIQASVDRSRIANSYKIEETIVKYSLNSTVLTCTLDYFIQFTISQLSLWD